jgi:trans-aconitate 2-methyltransferase
VRSKHKWNASDYADNSSAQAKWGRELISRLKLRGNESVLDIGCGDGKLTAALARQLPKGYVLGVDNSPEMIRFARKSFPLKQFPNLSFKVCDARKLTFSNKFDLVVSFSTLHWVKDHMKILKGIRRALKPGGRILLQFGGKGNAENIIAFADEAIASERWKKYFRNFVFPWNFYGPKEYSPWVKDSGLKLERIKLVEKDMVQEGREGLVGWCRTTWLPYIDRVPAEIQNEFLSDIVDRYLEDHPLDKNGRAHVKMQRLEVEGYKT